MHLKSQLSGTRSLVRCKNVDLGIAGGSNSRIQRRGRNVGKQKRETESHNEAVNKQDCLSCPKMRKFLSSLYWGETKPTQRVEVFDALWTDLVQTSERLGTSTILFQHNFHSRRIQIISHGRYPKNLIHRPPKFIFGSHFLKFVYFI
jgi:hypothetical protein